MPEPAAESATAPPVQPPALKASERLWTVPTVKATQSGAIVPDVQAMEQAMLEVAPILQRCGGVVSIHANRLQVTDQQIETSSVVVRWQAFSPVVTPEPEPEPEPGAEKPS